MAKKICSCSNFLSCFSCFSAANNHHASPSSTPPNAASLRVDTQTALSSSSDKEGTSSSGISAAVKQHDSQLPESASVSGSYPPSEIPSAPPCRQTALSSSSDKEGTSSSGISAAVKKHDSQLPESESVGGSSSPSKVPSPPPSIPSEPGRVGTIPTELPKNEKVGEGCSSSSRNDDATLQTAPDFISQIVTSSSGISAAVKRHDSQLPESASVGGSSSSSKVPSPPLCRQIELARGGAVPAKVPKDDLQPDTASKQSFSEADASGNEKVGEGRGSSSSRNADSTVDTVQDLSRQIVKDVDAVDGERVDLDGLMKHISQLLDIIEGKTSSPQRQRLAEDVFPTASKIFTKLKKFLFEAKDVIPGEPIKTAVNVVLKGMGAADLITTPFVVVANILDRVEEVGDNKNECITLLREMYILAELVKKFQERPQLMGTNGIIGVVKEAIELIVEGSILCCTQMQSSTFSKFWAAPVNKEDLSKFRQTLRDMYTHMNAQMNFRILDNLTKKPTLSREYPEHAVGMEEPVKEVLQLLDWKSEEKAVAVMLRGFGGMGKTTLGDAVFSKANFEGCKYSKVRLFQDIKSQPDIIQLQKSISEDLMEPEEKFPKITMYEDGQRELGKILAKVPAFLYIDNVLGEKELEQLLPKDVNKSKKLRLLFTARDEDVGTPFQEKTFYKIYDMKTISNSTAMSFFDDMKERLNSSQINDLINICGGVPLMLTLVAKVLSSEKDKQKAYYKVMQDKQNVNALTYRGAKEEYFFAYDYLPAECKDPFLDVCFFFKGWDWDTVADIVGEDQLDILEKRALVTKGIDSAASVHDVILTIGHEKAKGTRFKFTSSSQFDEFLYQDEEKDIKGIWFGENKDPCIIPGSKLESMCKSLRVVDLGNLTKVEGQCKKIFENLIYFQAGITRLPFDVSKIKKLRYLKYEPQDLALPKMPSSLWHMEFDGRLQSPAFEISSICLQQLGNLRILRLVKFAELKNLPERIGDQLKVLQELSLSHCKSLKKLPASISSLQSLRLLRMDYCSSLGQLAKDFGSLKSLQELNLQHCLNLRQLGEDFGSLNSLQELNLEGCAGLTTLPSNFEKLSSLRSLNLSYCENLEDLPRGLGNLSSLVALNFRKCLKLRSIPDSIGQLKLTASSMEMTDCSSLTELPDGFCNLSFITNLELPGCTSLHRLPTRFGELASLRRLLLNGCRSLERLPESFGQLRCLETLAMASCASLEELCNDFHCLTSLQFLNLMGCESLKKLPEDLHCLPSLQQLVLSYCDILEGKSMDNVLKIKTLKIVEIKGSGMLVDRWAEIQRESVESSSFQEKVYTGQPIHRENIERKILSQLEFLFSEGREKPFHPSTPLLLVVFDRFNDFSNNFPWPLIEETIDDIQISFEMFYIGPHFDKLPPKAKNIIVGHVNDPLKQEVVNLRRTMEVILGVLAGVQFFIQMTMVEDGGGGKCRPCWKLLTEREMEEFLLCRCRKYLQLKQLAETSQESSTKFLRELFAAGEAETCTFLKAASGSSKPLSCTAEDFKGKTILLEIRPLHVGYDLRLASLIQLYNTKKETFNLEIISIPLVGRSSSSRIDIFEQFSREIPWLVIQNPWAIPTAVKYFLMNLFAPHELEADSPFDIKIIESNGRIFTPSKPVMGLLARWGAKSYPFTLQKIEELKKEEWNQMETMPTLEFLFNELESVSDQVKEMMLQRKVVCLYGGSESDQNTMKEFTGLMRNAFISLSDNVHIIYIPRFKLKAEEENEVTDTISWSYQPLEMSRLAQAEMEGMLLLNLSQHDAFRFWRRIALLKEEMSEMYNRNTEQLSAMKMLFQCWDNENPWMILMDEEGKTITESGRKLVLSCRGSMEDEAKALIEQLVKGSKEQRKEALLKSEQWLKSEQLPCRLDQERGGFMI